VGLIERLVATAALAVMSFLLKAEQIVRQFAGLMQSRMITISTVTVGWGLKMNQSGPTNQLAKKNQIG